MFIQSEIECFTAREAKERAAALTAATENIRQAHLVIADAYAARILGAGPTPLG